MQIEIRREKALKPEMRIRQDLSPQQIREIRLAIREECNLKEIALWRGYGREQRGNVSEWHNLGNGGRVKRKLLSSDQQFGSYE